VIVAHLWMEYNTVGPQVALKTVNVVVGAAVDRRCRARLASPFAVTINRKPPRHKGHEAKNVE